MQPSDMSDIRLLAAPLVLRDASTVSTEEALALAIKSRKQVRFISLNVYAFKRSSFIIYTATAFVV